MALTGKIQSPLQGAVLLLAAVVVNYNLSLATAQPLDVAEVISQTAFGCPYLQSWAAASGCKGLYRAVSDRSWIPAADTPGLDKVISRRGQTYTCCDSADYAPIEGRCIKGASSDSDASCALADNYCPTLTVLKADQYLCSGKYTQTDDRTWSQDNGAYTLKLIGHDNSTQRLQLRCYIYTGAVEDGAVTEYTCHNPLLPDGKLKYGLNRIKDDWIFVVGHRGPGAMVEGDLWRSFEMTTTDASSSDEIVWVWPLGEEWDTAKGNKTVVIAQLHDDDRTAAVVQLSDVQKRTFKLRLARPACAAKHGKERVAILQMAKGIHKGSDGQVTLVNEHSITGVRQLKAYFPGYTLEGLPVVLTQLQRVKVGPADRYLTSRVTSRHTAGFKAQLQHRSGLPALAYSATLGSVAVLTKGRSELALSGSRGSRVVTKGEDKDIRTLHARAELARLSEEAIFRRPPLVFVEPQTYLGNRNFVARVVSSSTLHVSARLAEDSCGPSKPAMTKQSLGVVAIGETLNITKSEDCALIVETESDVQGLFVFAYKIFNAYPVFAGVDDDGNYEDLFIYASSGPIWTVSTLVTNVSDAADLGFVASPLGSCLDDNSPFFRRYKTSTLTGFSHDKIGNVRLAVSPMWTMCKPSRQRASGVKSSLLVSKRVSLTACAIDVKARHASAVVAFWHKGTHECFAGWGDSVALMESKSTSTVACTFQCRLLPGKMKSSSPRKLLGVRDTPWECFDLIYHTAPDAVGMTYATVGTAPSHADRGQCYAEFAGELLSELLSEGYVHCRMGGTVNGPNNKPPTVTTSTTAATTETTTTLPPSSAAKDASAAEAAGEDTLPPPPGPDVSLPDTKTPPPDAETLYTAVAEEASTTTAVVGGDGAGGGGGGGGGLSVRTMAAAAAAILVIAVGLASAAAWYNHIDNKSAPMIEGEFFGDKGGSYSGPEAQQSYDSRGGQSYGSKHQPYDSRGGQSYGSRHQPYDSRGMQSVGSRWQHHDDVASKHQPAWRESVAEFDEEQSFGDEHFEDFDASFGDEHFEEGRELQEDEEAARDFLV